MLDSLRFLFRIKNRNTKEKLKSSNSIGAPFQFSHVEHVEYNKATGIFTGIPEDWRLDQPSSEWSDLTMRALEELLDHRMSLDNKREDTSKNRELPQDTNKNRDLRVDINARDVFSAFPHLDLSNRVIKHGQYPIATNGAFADIWQGAFKDQLVAIKVLRVALAPDEKTKKRNFRELKAWCQLSHENILPLLGFSRGFGQHVSLVSPWQANGDACQYLKEKDATAVLRVINGAAAGLRYLHRCRVVHGDFRGNNILISSNGSAIVSDFGISRILGATGMSTSSTQGAVRWMAPELLENGNHSFESDVWAYGMTILELFDGQPPYKECGNDGAVTLKIMRGEKPAQSSSSVPRRILEGICLRCWNQDPSARPTMLSITQSIGIASTLEAQKLVVLPTGVSANGDGYLPTPPVSIASSARSP